VVPGCADAVDDPLSGHHRVSGARGKHVSSRLQDPAHPQQVGRAPDQGRVLVFVQYRIQDPLVAQVQDGVLVSDAAEPGEGAGQRQCRHQHRAQYRALVTAEGDLVVEHRGETTADITRASDGAMLDEVGTDGRSFQTFAADGTSITISGTGSGIVFSYSELEAQAFAEAGLPEAFLFLSGDLAGTVTWEPASEPGQEPTLVSAEITENTTEYVFDLCDLLDQAAEEGTGEGDDTSAP
jgi:hypothetical protein